MSEPPTRSTRSGATSGWRAFVAWGLCGALWAFSGLSFAGLFVLPLAAVLTWMLFRLGKDRRDATGLIAGAGGFLVLIGFLHVGDTPCPESGVLYVPAGQESVVSCGGLDSLPWFVSGSLIVTVAVALYCFLKRPTTEPTGSQGRT